MASERHTCAAWPTGLLGVAVIFAITLCAFSLEQPTPPLLAPGRHVPGPGWRPLHILVVATVSPASEPGASDPSYLVVRRVSHELAAYGHRIVVSVAGPNVSAAGVRLVHGMVPQRSGGLSRYEVYDPMASEAPDLALVPTAVAYSSLRLPPSTLPLFYDNGRSRGSVVVGPHGPFRESLAAGTCAHAQLAPPPCSPPTPLPRRPHPPACLWP